MAVSAGFRLAMKSRTRRLRRQEVVFFFVMMAVALPQIVQMWTELDEMGEPQVVLGAEKEA